MKTYFGVDYHKKFSQGTIMNEKGKQVTASLRTFFKPIPSEVVPL